MSPTTRIEISQTLHETRTWVAVYVFQTVCHFTDSDIHRYLKKKMFSFARLKYSRDIENSAYRAIKSYAMFNHLQRKSVLE